MEAPSRAPVYAYLVPLLTAAARSVGYALAVHGSMARDLDLVAVPWTDEAQNADALISALLAACGFTTPNPERPAISSGPTAKPHGRTSWTVPLDGGCYIDLSVMPRGGVAPVVPARETRDAEDSCAEFKIGTDGHRDCTGDGHYRCRECAHFMAPKER